MDTIIYENTQFDGNWDFSQNIWHSWRLFTSNFIQQWVKFNLNDQTFFSIGFFVIFKHFFHLLPMLNKNIQKIIIAGDGGTGKSTLLSTKIQGSFCSAPKITVGIDFKVIKANTSEHNINPDFLAFDLGGQQRFQFIHDSYIRGSRGAIILYDLTREKTFENLLRWIDLVCKDNPDIAIIIAGTKKDLAQPEDVSKYYAKWAQIQEGLDQQRNILEHLQISSKNFDGIEEIFEKLSHAISIRFCKS